MRYMGGRTVPEIAMVRGIAPALAPPVGEGAER